MNKVCTKLLQFLITVWYKIKTNLNRILTGYKTLNKKIMKNLITIGSKIGFRQRNNRFKWNEIVSMENDIFTIRDKQSKHYANHFQMEYSKISIAIKEKNIKIICNTKLY